MKSNKYTVLIKNTLIFGLGLFGSKLIQFILLPFFTNILTPAEYGVIDLVVTFANLLVPIITFNLADAVLRFGLSKRVNKGELLQNSFFILVIGIVITFSLSPFLGIYSSFKEWRTYIIPIIIIQSIRTNFSLYVKANERLFIFSLDSIFSALIIAISNVLLIAGMKYGIRGYFISEIVGGSFSIIFLFFGGKIVKDIKFPMKINKVLMKEMLLYSTPLIFNAVSWWITNFSDRIVLISYFTEKEVGIYSVAAKIPAIVTTALSVFTQAWIVSAVKEYEASKDVRFFKKVYRYYTCFLFSMTAIGILIVKPFMLIYVGPQFQDASQYVPLLLLAVAFLGISNFYGAIYAAAKANIKEVWTTILCAVSNIILNLLLIPVLGIMGAVIATMFSYVIIVLVRIINTKSIINICERPFYLLANALLIAIETLFIIKFNSFFAAILIVIFIVLFNLYILRKGINTFREEKI